MNLPIDYLVYKLLKINHIYIDENKFIGELKSHNSYPSLYAVQSVLDHFLIKNIVVKIEKDQDYDRLIPKEFITTLSFKDLNGFALVKRCKNSFNVQFDSKQEINISTDKFIDNWSGLVLAVERGEKLSLWQFLFKFIVKFELIILSVFLVFLIFYSDSNLYTKLMTMSSFTGSAICIILLKHEYNLKQKGVEKICNADKFGFDCNSILNSKYSYFFSAKLINLIGIFFFTLSLSWSFVIVFHQDFKVVSYITFLSLPGIAYSLYHQLFSIKKLCPLCLSLIGILIFQLSIIVGYYNSGNWNFILNIHSVVYLVFSFIMSVLAWNKCNENYYFISDYYEHNVEYLRLKRDFNRFYSELIKSPVIDTCSKEITDVCFGNTSIQKDIEIVVVTNPSCKNCKNVALLLKQIQLFRRKNLEIRIRFYINSLKENKSNSLIASRLLEIFYTSKDDFLVAFEDNYRLRDLNKWIKKWGMPEDPGYEKELLIHRNWCNENKIKSCPSLFINGHLYPKMFDLKELHYFLDSLTEKFKK